MYDCLFGQEQDHSLALDTMRVWQRRAMNLFPAALSATLVLLQADQKCAQLVADDRHRSETRQIQVGYAMAFNQFMNYIHSLTRSQCSMYGAARELGLNSFIVDIRHMCSHSAEMPAIETFQMCSAACMNWLQIFYWDNLIKEVSDVTATELLWPAGSKMEGIRNEFAFLLEVYDYTAHLLWRKASADTDGAPENFVQYSQSLESGNLMLIRAQVLRDLASVFENNSGDVAVGNTFCHLVPQCLTNMLTNRETKDHLPITVVHQNLFHMLANVGLIPQFLRRLFCILNNADAPSGLRTGAIFWAEQILKTCLAFRVIKEKLYKELSPEKFAKLNWNSINTKSLDRVIENAFSAEGLQRADSLLFGRSMKSHWTVRFSKEYVRQQLTKVNTENAKVATMLLEFAHPPFEETDKWVLSHVIEIYVSPFTEMQQQHSADGQHGFKLQNLESMDGGKDSDMGIWSLAPPNIDWSSSCLGTLPRQLR